MSESAVAQAMPPAPDPLPAVRPATAVRATFDALMKKAKRVEDITIPNPDGPDLEVTVEAISYFDYDKLVGECPPNESDRFRGASYDLAKFGPRLMAACITDPPMSVGEAESLWKNPAWAGGEIVGLFNRINLLCQRGLEVPFTAPG